MSLLERVWNKIQYVVHEKTYDAKAEEFARKKKQRDEEEQARVKKAVEDKKRAEEEAKKKEAEDAKQKSEAAKRLQAENERGERNNFDVWRLVGRIYGTAVGIVTSFLVIAAGIWGASLATNLNLYRAWPYRILYAVYGFLFFFITIPYTMAYRWWWKGKKPRYYALIPLVPYHFDHPFTAFFLSWLSFRPDDQIDCLKEWEKEQREC
jgi:cation transport ATPase